MSTDNKAKDTAARLLDLWVEEQDPFDLDEIVLKFTAIVRHGYVPNTEGWLETVHFELRKQRRERGWPDPKPAPPEYRIRGSGIMSDLMKR
jgi:hypothetical protein